MLQALNLSATPNLSLSLLQPHRPLAVVPQNKLGLYFFYSSLFSVFSAWNTLSKYSHGICYTASLSHYLKSFFHKPTLSTDPLYFSVTESTPAIPLILFFFHSAYYLPKYVVCLFIICIIY